MISHSDDFDKEVYNAINTFLSRMMELNCTNRELVKALVFMTAATCSDKNELRHAERIFHEEFNALIKHSIHNLETQGNA
jgi:deoxycytidylate deaminase